MSKKSRPDGVEVVLSRASGRWRDLADSVKTVADSLRSAVGDEAFSALVPAVAKHQRDLERALQRFENAARRPEVVIATTGTTSSGKSTLANLLIGDLLLPKAVQEMSAGVVTIRHSAEERQLVVEETRGATWPTGTWEGVSAESVRNRLKSTMQSYRDLLGDASPSNNIEPPRFRITWPTRLGQSPHRFGLPANADITIVDLPGLKYVDDEVNGGVVREQARKALCVVAYNSFETDPRKQDALLRQIVDQVKALGGSPARMLFVLNRIDAFRTDSDPEASERAFCDRVTRQIRTRIRDALSEYSSEASSIEAIPLSSEPALYAVLASQSGGDEQATLLARLEDEYKTLFSRKAMNSLPRDPVDWTESQRRWFMDEARVQSRAEQFEEHLGAHVAAKLPEILLPDLVDGVYQPARQVLQGLDALVEAYGKQERAQLDEAIGRLEDLHRRLRQLQKEALDPLGPLREVAAGDGDLVGKLLVAVPEVERSLGLSGPDGGPGQLSSLQSALTDAVQDPLQRLNDFVFRLMEGEDLEDPFIDACPSAVALHQAVGQLRASPFGRTWKSGGSFEDGNADAVRTALNGFAAKLSNVATELVKRESRVQADRMKIALDVCGATIVEGLERESESMVAELGFRGLRGVFRGSFDLSPPRLPRVKFAANISDWSRIEERTELETYYVEKRVWWKLWLGKSTVRQTRSVVKTTTHRGIAVEKLGDLLDAFATSGGVEELEEFFGAWLAESIESFEQALDRRLREGVKTYRLAFEERVEELKHGAQRRIEGAESRRTEVTRALLSVDQNREWRSYA